MSRLWTIRDQVQASDLETVRDIIHSTGYFSLDEEKIAVELVQERLDRGAEKSGYLFHFLEQDGEPIAYSCFGLIPCSTISYDLYWIATHQDHRGQGMGRYLLAKTEEAVRSLGGVQIYAETSGKEQYAPTRQFYLANEYRQTAFFKDFYDHGDAKVVYEKRLLP